jgi:pimeloyl-ACP methyl ester carboxylesterase
VIVVPAWVSNLDVIADGRDPRSSLIEHLARNRRAITYDRRGTGLSGGTVRDFGVEASVGELEAVLEHLDEPAALFAMSGAGPIALACAARSPERVSHLVLFGTYASGPKTFGDVGRPILDLLRQRPTLRPNCWPACTGQERRVPRLGILGASCGTALRRRWLRATSKRSTRLTSRTSSRRSGRRHWCCTTAVTA